MTQNTKTAFPPPISKMAQFLDRQIYVLTGIVTQVEMATALGYPKANIISMFRGGQTKVPLGKIPDLAKVLRVDPTFLMRLAVDQYCDDKWDALGAMFKNLMTGYERQLVDVVREATDDTDYQIPDETLEEIRKLVKKAKAREERRAGKNP